MKRIASIIVLLMFFACKSENKIENPNNLWTESELQELYSLVNDLDQVLMNQYNSTSIEESYLDFSDFFLKNINSVPIFDEFISLSSKAYELEFFDKIWGKMEYLDSEENYIAILSNSEYIDYLKHLGKESNFIKQYAENIENSGGIQASVVAGFAENINQIDLKDINNRLIFTIHYFTLQNR